MKVTPIKSMQLQGRISMFEASLNHVQFILDDRNNNHYILDKDFEVKTQFETTYKRSTLSAIHPTEPYAAIMGKEDALHIVGLDGVDIWTKPGDYIAACWALDGSSLYSLLRLDSDTLQLIVYDNAGGVVSEEVFKGEFYESSAFLSTIPNHEEIAMQLMAGQDGCSTTFIALNGDNRLSFAAMPAYSYTCVSFDEAGSRFLCIENDEKSIHHFTYPGLEEIGMYQFEYDLHEGSLDYTLIYLYDKAIIQYGECFYLLDIKTMEVVEDFVITGHEPVPVHEIYKNLEDDDSLICDISYMCSAGKHIIGFAERDGISDIIVLSKVL